MRTKICSTCKEAKSLDEYGKDKRNKYNDFLKYSCKECSREYFRKYYKKPENKQKQLERAKKWRMKQAQKKYKK